MFLGYYTKIKLIFNTFDNSYFLTLLSSPYFSVNYLQDKEDITRGEILNKLSSSPLLFQKNWENKLKPLLALIYEDQNKASVKLLTS